MLKMVFVTDVFCQGPQSSGTTTSPPILLELEDSHGHHVSRRAWLCPSI